MTRDAFVLATGNADKAREIGEILSEVWDDALALLPLGEPTVAFFVTDPRRLVPPPDLVRMPDVEETGSTLEANAAIKARALHDATGLDAVADDTGLEVDALGGAPGVHSARYAGPAADSAANVAKLLAALRGVPAEARTARFATVAVVVAADGSETAVRGEVEGCIAEAPRGERGFGYDPVFVPAEGDGRTFAEMTADEKHAISHRGRAFRQVAWILGAA